MLFSLGVFFLLRAPSVQVKFFVLIKPKYLFSKAEPTSKSVESPHSCIRVTVAVALALQNQFGENYIISGVCPRVCSDFEKLVVHTRPVSVIYRSTIFYLMFTYTHILFDFIMSPVNMVFPC